MSEIWLRPDVTDDMVRLLGYTLFRCDRVGRSGGELHFIYQICSVLPYCVARLGLSPLGQNTLLRKFHLLTRLLLAVIYRSPNAGYMNEFFLKFLEFQANYRHSIILGDFNADLNQSTFDSQQLGTFIAASTIYFVPYETTHHLRNFSTLLDLCIIDDRDKLRGYG